MFKALELILIEDSNPFCVVIGKEMEYADILKSVVLMKERNDCLILLLKNEISVEQVIEQGATKFADAEINAEIQTP